MKKQNGKTSPEAICREIAEAVDDSLTSRAIDFLLGDNTKGYVDYLPHDGGIEWIEALKPEILEHRKALKVEDKISIEDKLPIYEANVTEAGFYIGLFAGAKLAGASRERLLELAAQLARMIQEDRDFLEGLRKREEARQELQS